MSEPHRINLSTAWEPPPEGSRAWARRFGRPSGVEAGGRVYLVVEGGIRVTLVLNGVCLSAESGRHDVTDLLEPRNELLLVPSSEKPALSTPAGDAASPALAHGRCNLDPQHGRVHLEIEASDS